MRASWRAADAAAYDSGAMSRHLWIVIVGLLVAGALWLGLSPRNQGPQAVSATALSDAARDGGSQGELSSPDTVREPIPAGSAVQAGETPERGPETPTSVSGRVIDDVGDPVAEAVVRIWPRATEVRRIDDAYAHPAKAEVLTAADGTFRMLVGRGRYTLSAENRERRLMTARTTAIDLEAYASLTDVTLRIAPTAILTGTLRDADGQPVAGHRFGGHLGGSETATAIPGVTLAYDEFHFTTTAADGSFAIRCVRDHEYLWEVQHARHPMWRGNHAPAQGSLQVVLPRGERVRGVVFRADGRPAAGATITAPDYPPREAVTDAQGSFEIVGLEMRAETHLRVFDPASAVFVLQPLPAERADVRITLEPALAVGGEIVDESGRGMAGAGVSVVGDRRFDPGYTFGGVPSWEWAHDREQAVADAAGRFRFENLYSGRLQITVDDPRDRRLKLVTEAAAGNVALRIIFDRAAARRAVVRGRVTDVGTGAPIASFQVGPRLAVDNQWSWTGFADAAGRYELVGLEPGDTVLHFAAAGYAPRQVSRTLALGEDVCDVALAAVRDATVQVVDAQGAPVPARIEVLDERGDPLTIGVNPGMTSTAISTGSDGKARLFGLPAQRLTARVLVEAREDTQDRTLDLRSKPDGELRLVVDGVPPAVGIDLILLGHEPGTDLSAFQGPPDDAWLATLRQRRDVWAFASGYTATLATAGGRVLAVGRVTHLGGEGPGMQYAYALKTERQQQAGTMLVAWALPLSGRRVPMSLRVAAEGHAPAERTLSVMELGQRRRVPVAVFLERRR